ncbi:MAG TPA: FtsH protease activity modulator HflK [Geminicoccaceae bacterium]|jgi:membrane protease subunit HflK|nr:FtsH protease activity modulator HflK [Geminicoccaceae bacterium]HZA66949.1 FtsH protease activity modulator HflK [Geminicoccaceae bacterium]
MPWSNQGGGWQGGGGQGPWGGRPGGGGQQPPDLEELLRRSQEKVKRLFPGGGGGGFGGNRRGLVLIPLIVVAIWLASGFYRVQPDEQGVVLRFGEWIKTTQPGLNWHFPSPIETVFTPKVTRVNRVEVGFRGAADLGSGGSTRDVANESLMLTGDENIVDINFVLLWQIKDAGQFLFNIRDPESTVKAVAESVMREIIGKTPIVEATTEGRGAIELAAREQAQQILDDYGAGILVTQVQLQKVDPPSEVIDAFRDVQRAQADRERLQNEAEAYANDILPRARGESERILQEAQAYRQEVVARAEGDAQRFVSVYDEYVKAQDVTIKRIYLETMEDVLRDMNKVVIDRSASGGGVVPYLPLPELERRARQRAGEQIEGQGEPQ